MIKIFQDDKVDLIETKKTIAWLVENTSVSVFDPISFKGYQRKINEKHCMKIVDFIKSDFFMPTAIICATDGSFDEKTKLRIVDGQHRVNAFKMMKRIMPERYEEIKNYELAVIVLANADENIEIDTFITINKTSKKVDTSLAFVLKNKINRSNKSNELTISKAEYVAVELAQWLNYKKNANDIWFDKIIFEGTPKNTAQLISLNAFVKSTRVLLNNMAKKGYITLEWNEQKEIEACIDQCYRFIVSIWTILRNKWPELFWADLDRRRIIQGAIGYTAINKVVIELLKNEQYYDLDDFLSDFENMVQKMTIEANVWMPGGIYSQYSSESGYRIVAMELLSAMRY